MNVMSLFDGMSCGMIALERAGIPVTKYHASEVDKYAIQVSQVNYPDIQRWGDVTRWRTWAIDWSSIDLLVGGSPCQGFSAGGKGLGFSDDRSKLALVFFEILRRIQYANPNVKFLLENVRMSEDNLNYISAELGVPPVLINSQDFSAQHRARFYWTNVRIPPLPAPNPDTLSSVLQSNVARKYYLSDKALAGFKRKSERRKGLPGAFGTLNLRKPTQKCTCISARYYKSGIGDAMVEDVEGIRKLTPIECERLQTVPDNYTNHVSNTQRYKMLGNGWTVDVIAHIFKGLIKEDV